MHRFVLAGLVSVAALLTSAPAQAQVEVPQGSVGILGQVAQNTGEAGAAYRFAWLAGVSASYEIGQVSNVGFGPAWSWAFGAYQVPADNLPDDHVTMVEMSLGLRVRRMLGKSTPRFLTGQAGATILRFDRAVPPDNDRLYLGPYIAIGLDQYLGTGTMVSFAVRYGMIATGPASLALRLGISLGS